MDLKRYSEKQRVIIFQYFDMLKDTRRTGKIAENILNREIKYWEKFSPALVIEALRVHIQKYPSMRESYTRGIMRNLELQGFQETPSSSALPSSSNRKQTGNYTQQELDEELRLLESLKRKRNGE